jgi:Trk K+ transport system NAD-binding subunit
VPAIQVGVYTIDAMQPPEGVAPIAIRHRYIVCGDSNLAYRLVTELLSLPDTDVTVVMRRSHGDAEARMGLLPDIEIVYADRDVADALTGAQLQTAEAIALTDQDDIANLDAALVARELATDIRIVVRMFDEVLADSVHELIPDCAVLSATAVAAPAFVTAAVGHLAPAPLRLFDRSVYVAERAHTRPDDVLCGLAVTAGRSEPLVLPAEPADADLVLAAAILGEESEPAVATAADVHRRARRRALFGLLSLVGRRLRLVVGVLLLIVVAGTVTLVAVEGVSVWKGFYLAVLSTFAGAAPDLSADLGEQILHIVFTVVSIATIPLVTAAVVETVVSARLALASGGLAGPVESHVVVVGLGDMGTRVLTALDDLGVAVVGIDRNPAARGVEVARQRRIPVIVGDAGRQETLRSASVQSARSLVVLTSSDLANVQTALLARKVNPGTHTVLRLFDGDFAERIQHTFGFATSRSVSALAAPSFAAAMLDHEVIATVPVRRRVLLVAQLPVGAGSLLEGRNVGDVHRAGVAHVVAIRTGRGAQTLWLPPAGRKLARTDTILTVSTRDGLGDLLYRASPAEEASRAGAPRPVTPFDAPAATGLGAHSL